MLASFGQSSEHQVPHNSRQESSVNPATYATASAALLSVQCTNLSDSCCSILLAGEAAISTEKKDPSIRSSNKLESWLKFGVESRLMLTSAALSSRSQPGSLIGMDRSNT